MIISKIYTAYVSIVFAISFLITYPLQLILIQFNSTKKIAHFVNYLIIKIVILICFIRVEFKGKNNIKRYNKFIFCSNHSSYLDIPCLFLLQPRYIKFIGKSSLSKIPLFGYMYRKLYITVNRRDKDSRNQVLIDAKKALDEGLSIAIYPEGAIPPSAPKMISFKEGAFRLSVENNTPIVPVTLLNNHQVMPVERFILHPKKVKIIIHKPLNTPEKPFNNINELKEKAFEIIQSSLELEV